jgi:CRISPR-associated protein Cas2
MVVMTLERVPAGLRGLLSRWLIEVQVGVFVGTITAQVRDLLWERATERSVGGRVFQAWSASNEQGFSMRLHGDNRRRVMDFDGLELVLVLPTAGSGGVGES